MKAEVSCPHEDHHHRGLDDIRHIIEASSLEPDDKESSLRIFSRLAEAEGKIHGHPVDEVHFHEVGATDAIADVVGAVAGIRLLGLERLYVSRFTLGRGFVNSAHGRLPLPAPAAMELLRGFETLATDIEGELVTPTGAAILTAVAEPGPPPPFTIARTGYGAGAADRPELPNLLRLIVGSADMSSLSGAETDRLWVVETNVDDMSGELCGHLYERLFSAGAIDVFMTPVHMKKSRPGLVVTCLVPIGSDSDVEQVLFKETTTFGIRKHIVERTKLARETKTVHTRYGEIRVKVGRLGQKIVTVSPEYEDCRRAAESANVPLKEVYAEATRLAETAR
jgi:hypothetical protein